MQNSNHDDTTGWNTDFNPPPFEGEDLSSLETWANAVAAGEIVVTPAIRHFFGEGFTAVAIGRALARAGLSWDEFRNVFQSADLELTGAAYGFDDEHFQIECGERLTPHLDENPHIQFNPWLDNRDLLSFLARMVEHYPDATAAEVLDHCILGRPSSKRAMRVWVTGGEF